MAQLEFDHLRKRFGAVQALDDLSFAVSSGEIFGFVGSNGAGKSTAMRIALGVLSTDSGQVLWSGKPLDAVTRRTIGYMPEERGLYPRMKVGEQLVYLARLHGWSRRDAERAMDEWTQRLGIEARRGDDIVTLSLGNQQRVQLAAALIHSPQILILDEPFSGLDPVAVDVMSTVLKERAAAGVPVLFSSHQLDLVERLCDRVGIIRAGRIEALGTIDELRATARPAWSIVAPQAPPGWAASVPGVTVTAQEGARVVIEARGNPTVGHQDSPDQQALRAALAYGPVTEFAPVRPPLTDLFRHLVSEETSPATSSEESAHV